MKNNLMGIQTEAMRAGAEKNVYAFKDVEGYFGIEYVNHPTPSDENLKFY